LKQNGVAAVSQEVQFISAFLQFGRSTPTRFITNLDNHSLTMGGETERSSTFEPNAIRSATDWTGFDDPDNPRNFSRGTRVYSTVSVTVLAFVTAFAASIYSPGIDGVSAEFGVSRSVAILPLSLYNLGLAAGPMLGSPLSETYGRKIVLLVTTPGFMAFTLGAALAGDIVSLTVCRFFAGVCAAPAVGNASASICDYTSGSKRAVSMAFYYAVPTFGASLGPLGKGSKTEKLPWILADLFAVCVPSKSNLPPLTPDRVAQWPSTKR
jgi:hypothetical protein